MHRSGSCAFLPTTNRLSLRHAFNEFPELTRSASTMDRGEAKGLSDVTEASWNLGRKENECGVTSRDVTSGDVTLGGHGARYVPPRNFM
jgi:hypothetical protein